MLYQVQWLGNESGAWNILEAENGDKYFGSKEEAELFAERQNEQYNIQTRVVAEDDDIWI